MIRRDIPKRTSLDALALDDVRQVENQLNHLPRRILSYKTPAEVFYSELKRTRHHLSYQTITN